MCQNYACPIYKNLLQNAGDATMHNSLKIPYPISHVCITLVRIKTGDKISLLLAYNNFLNLIIYAAIVHNYMILSETSIEEFPLRRRQIIIKKYPRELYSPVADHPGVYLIKQSQSVKKPVQAF